MVENNVADNHDVEDGGRGYEAVDCSGSPEPSVDMEQRGGLAGQQAQHALHSLHPDTFPLVDECASSADQLSVE